MEDLDTAHSDPPPPTSSTRLAERVLHLEDLKERLTEELARALRYSRPLAIAELSLEGLDPAHRGAAATLVSQHVRRQDVLGYIGDDRILAVLPETPNDGATALAQRLVGALSPIASGVRAAIATCPADGSEADALIEKTSSALGALEPGQIAPSSGSDVAQTMGKQFRPIDEEVRELERARMREALDAAGGNQTRAAMLIAMPLRTFVSKLKVYGLPTGGRKRRTPIPPSNES